MHPRWKTQDEFPGSISIPFGIKTSHTWHEVGQILRIINDLDVETFVEIGAHVGGLGSIVSCVEKYKPFKYIGIEINREVIDERMVRYINQTDAMKHETAEWLSKKMSGKTMFYCDGGNKIAEMFLYRKCLKSGDIIACHDYFDGQEVFGLHGFGRDKGECGCVPEVFAADLKLLNETMKSLPKYLLMGTRIMGYEN